MSSVRSAYETDSFSNHSGVLQGVGRGRAVQVPSQGGTVVVAAHDYRDVYSLAAGLEFAPTDSGPWMLWKPALQRATTESNPLFTQVLNAPAGAYFRVYVHTLQGDTAQVNITIMVDD